MITWTSCDLALLFPPLLPPVFTSFALCARPALNMLVSTRIIVQYGSRKVVERDWRIAVIPDEDVSSGATVLSLFQGIVDHSFDSMEPSLSLPTSLTSWHQVSFLPGPVADGEHYKPFGDVYGTLTNEKDRPSLKLDTEKRGPIFTKVQNAWNHMWSIPSISSHVMISRSWTEFLNLTCTVPHV